MNMKIRMMVEGLLKQMRGLFYSRYSNHDRNIERGEFLSNNILPRQL